MLQLPFGKNHKDLAYATNVGSQRSMEKKKKVKLKLKFQRLLDRDAQAVEMNATESGFSGGVPQTPPEPQAPKPKKEKKPKREKRGEGKKYRFLIGLGCGAILVGAVSAIVIVVTSGADSVEKQLERAANYTDKGHYEKAEEIYNELLIGDVTLVPAYLGFTDNYLAQQDEEGAITILERGYFATDDPTIAAMLDQLRPMEEEEPQGPSALPIQWQDQALEQMVRSALPELGSGPITEEDLEKVTTLKIVGGTHVTTSEHADKVIRNRNTAEGYTIEGMLYTERGGIRSLKDLSHFVNLKKLVIGYNQIGALDGIEGLTKLETVGLYCNDITDITPLSMLENIKYLYIYHNQITDISPLAALPNLRSVYLQNNRIRDLSPLGGSVNLRHLYISDNQITDISPVGGLRNLAIIMAEDNTIDDLSPVQGLGNLTDVDFSGNPATDYSPTAHITNVNINY